MEEEKGARLRKKASTLSRHETLFDGGTLAEWMEHTQTHGLPFPRLRLRDMRDAMQT